MYLTNDTALQLLFRKSGLQCRDRRREEIFTTFLINPWEIAELEEMGMLIGRVIEDADMTLCMVWTIPLANERVDARAFFDTLVWREDFVACPAFRKEREIIS